MIIDPVFPVWLVVIVLIPLTFFLLWHEWKRKQNFLFLRMISTLVISISLAAIILKPGYLTKKTSSIILLTQGYTEKKVDSILQADSKLTVMHAENSEPYKNSQLLPFQSLAQYDAQLRFVVGQGLPHHALDLLDNKAFDFIPASLPSGITSLFIPENMYAHRINFLTGTVNSNPKDWIYLFSPGGKEDSVQLSKKGLTEFKLPFVPKQTGNFLYTLSIADSSRTFLQEHIPVSVKNERRLRILFLQHYPTFETRYLKNFLEQKDHRVVLRQQLSKNNFRYEYVNHNPIQVHKLTSEILSQFDLVITDREALESLSQSEKNSLKLSIRSGLGLLNLLGSPKSNTSSGFIPFKFIAVKNDTTIIRAGSKVYNLPTPKHRVIPDRSFTTVQKNKSGILSGYTVEGLGKIGVQILQETYRLTLSGDSTAYSELWTPLLEQISKRQSETASIKIMDPFPWYEDDPINIEVISSKENISLLDDSIRLSLKEDVLVDNVWYGKTWASTPGWHTLTVEGSFPLSYYVSKKNDWRSLAVANQMEANKVAKNGSLEESGAEVKTQKEISPILFYLAFLLAAGFIWLSPKL